MRKYRIIENKCNFKNRGKELGCSLPLSVCPKTLNNTFRKSFHIFLTLILFTLFLYPSFVYSATLEERLVDQNLLIKMKALKELRNEGVSAIPKLKNYLKTTNKDLRELALIRLGELKATEAVQDIIDRLKNDEKEYIRERAVNALVMIKAKSAIEDLKDRAGNASSDHDRMMAVIGLGNIVDVTDAEFNEVISLFKDRLNYDSSGHVRMRSAYMLGKFNDETGYAKAIDEFQNSQDRLTREYAVNALGEIGRSEAISIIESKIQNEHIWVEIRGKVAVEKIKYKNLSDPPAVAARKLKQISNASDETKINHLIENVIKKDKQTEVITWACEELIKFGSTGIEELKKIANEEYENLCHEIAFKTLVRNGIYNIEFE